MSGRRKVYIGSDSADYITVTRSNNIIRTYEGDDTIIGNGKRDRIFAGDGDDYIESGRGRDQIIAGDGNDTVYAGCGRDTVNGGDGDDWIHAGSNHDKVYAGAGNDTIFGALGQDLIYAGSGDDYIASGRHNDTVFAMEGNDWIIAGAGNDIFKGGNGFDVLELEGTLQDYDLALNPLEQNYPAQVQAITADVQDMGLKSLTSIEALYFAKQDLVIFIDGTNNPVFAADDKIEISENDVAYVSFNWLTENDWDFDEDALTITAVAYSDETLTDLSINAFYENGYLELVTGDAFDFLKEGETLTREFELTVSDGRGGEDTSILSVTITGVNDAPEMEATDQITINENETFVHGLITTFDAEGDEFSFRIAASTDSDLFKINAETGEVSFKTAPDFETPLDEDGDNIYDLTIEVVDAHGASSDHQTQITVADVDETPPAAPRINEIHYENSGDDIGEFIEIRIPKGTDISTIAVQLYDGTSGQMYHEFSLTPQMKTLETEDFDYYVWQDETIDLQNGIRDGISITDGTQVIEFLSYEGVFTATDGPAQGMQSEDILVQERGIEAPGLSLQRNEDNTWSWPDTATKGTENGFKHDSTLRINEIHYDNVGTDTGEFIEFRAEVGDNLENVMIEIYNGATGRVIKTANLDDFTITTDGTYDYFSWELPENGLQNGGSTPEAIAISQDGVVIEFLSYEGDMLALNGTAQGLQSMDIGVSEDGTTPIGYSLQRMEGDDWMDATEATLGFSNDIGAITHDFLG